MNKTAKPVQDFLPSNAPAELTQWMAQHQKQQQILPQLLNDYDINQLWLGMIKIFGLTWVNWFGESDDGTWLSGLCGLTPAMLAKGFVACRDLGLEFPPNLGRFRSLCLGRESEAQVIEDAIRGSDKPLPGLLRKRLSSWELRHATEAVLRKKLSAYYPACVREYEHQSLNHEYNRLIACEAANKQTQARPYSDNQ